MTRFARAKGSKASNERHPEEATEWHVMKQQIINNRNKTEEPPADSTSTEANVKCQPATAKEEKNIQWSDFPDTNPIKAPEKTTQPPKLKKMKKKRLQDESSKKGTGEGEGKPIDCETEVKNNTEEKQVTKRQRGKKRKLEEEASTAVDVPETNKPQNNDEKRVKKRQRGKKRKLQKEASTEVDDQETNKPQNNDESEKFKDKGMNNKKKFKGDNFKRRKPQNTENFVGIHGTTIEIMYFDGFPVKKEDCLRLIQLRRDLIKKGVPKSTVEVSIKLERRRAEKALSNEKKKVCFNCRKSGHNISDCPELKDGPNPEMTATGICFKCGSTQHISVQCKVTQGDSFKFATCFICKEVGHISRQCPNNTRGIYPHGGSCNLCGDVTHLKINCPQFQAEKQENTIYAEVIGGDVESLGGESKKVVKAPPINRTRHIKF